MRSIKLVVGIVIGAILLALVVVVVLGPASYDRCSPGDSAGSGGPASSEGLAYPVDQDAPVTSPFGPRGGEAHNGMDLAPPRGAPIYAFADGIVIASQDTGVSGFGGWIVVLHEIDGREMSTVYGHQDPGGNLVAEGATVEAGEHIARVGNSGYSTGPHLHFELYEGNRLAGGTPIDPAPWVERARTGASAPEGDGEDRDDESESTEPGTIENGDTSGSDTQTIRDLRASQIIDVGQQRDESEIVIVSALAAGLVESDLHNLASEAVPESKNYPNDGVAPGDYDSVGLFQQRVKYWAEQAGGIKGLMEPAQQINWYYDTAAGVSHDSVGQIAADVENPAAKYRHKYADRAAEAAEYYERLSGNAAGSLAAGSAECGGSGSLAGVPSADGLGRRILMEAKKGFGMPYVWGGGNTQGPTNGLSGNDPLGYDCSGLTQFSVYQATGGQVSLPRTAQDQGHSDLLQEVSWEEARPGDLLFFGSGHFHHVSIYSGQQDGADMQYEAQTFGVPVGEYEVWQPPDKVMRVVLDEGEAETRDE